MDQNVPDSSDKFMLRAEKEDKKQTPKIFQFFKKTTGSLQTSSSSSFTIDQLMIHVLKPFQSKA